MSFEKFKEAYNLFDPEMALTDQEKRKRFYVDRKDMAIEQFKLGITLSEGPTKFLFTAHRGCGKSTELFNLVSELEDQYFTVFYSIGDVLEITDVDFVDILVSMSSKLYEQAKKKNIRIRKELIENIYQWFSQTVKISYEGFKKEASFAEKLSLYFIKLTGKIQAEAVTRKEMRQELRPRISELRERIDLLIAEVWQKSKKEVIVVIDDIDKVPLEQAEKVFGGHTQTLTSPCCKIIFTIPFSLLFSRAIAQLEGYFQRFDFPVIRICNQDGSKNEEAYVILRKIVEKRIPLELFEDKALDELIAMSGGVLRELADAVQKCCLECVRLSKEQIDLKIVESIKMGRRNSFVRQLEQEDYEKLKNIRPDIMPKKDERFMELLHNLSILCYINDDIWYNVHPVIKLILEEKKYFSPSS